MVRPYSNDLRERSVRAVLRGGLSCHQAAAQFGVAISTAINWVRRLRGTGSVGPDQIGGYRSMADHDLSGRFAPRSNHSPVAH